MKIISHRGNLEGRDISRENKIFAIDECINKYKFDVEIDVRYHYGTFYLGHDSVDFTQPISVQYMKEKANYLWVHCKNLQTLATINNLIGRTSLNYFFHDKDFATLTSCGFMWVHPDAMYSVTGSIAVMPEYASADFVFDNLYGICTDYPVNVRNSEINNSKFLPQIQKLKGLNI